MRNRSARGFTLIELLVVLAILSVVTTLGTVTLVQLWERWGELKTASVLDARAERAFQSMRKDFAAAVASPIAGVALQGTSGSEEDSQFYDHPLRSDQFTLPVDAVIANGKATMLAGYRIERKDGESSLVRTEQPLRGGGQAPGRVVAVGVLKMHVEYAGAGGGWTDGWAQPGNPKAVRVSLLLAEPDHPKRQQTARKAVFTVNVP